MASTKILEQKKKVVEEIVGKLKKSESVVIFQYQGMTVEEISALRKELKTVNAEVKVYKNTLLKKAADELNINLDAFLEGPNAILFGESLLEPIKIVSEFAKKNDKSDKVTLDMVKDDSVSWDEAVTNFNHAKRKVLFIRKDIEKDKQILCSMYKSQENLIKQQSALDKLNMEKIITEQKLVKEQELLTSNEKDTLSCEEEIKYIIQHSSFIKKY